MSDGTAATAAANSAHAYNLPDELLQLAFHGLDLHCRIAILPRVSRLWRALLAEPRSWLYVRVDPIRAPLFEPFQLTYLCTRFAHALSLDLAGCARVCDRSMALLLLHATSLTSIDLSHCGSMSDAVLTSIAAGAGASSLRLLRMQHNDHISRVGLSALAAACPRLEVLDVSQCEDVCDAALIAVARSCVHLREVAVRQCVALSDDGVAALAHGCPALERMDLCGLDELSNNALQSLGEANLRCLTHLSLSHCKAISDRGVGYLAAGCSALLHLDLTACYQLSSDALGHIAANCTQLLHLNLGWLAALTDGGIDTLARGCKRLRWLSIEKCTKLGDASLLALATHCRQLEHLNASHVYQLTDVGVQHVANGMRGLRVFECEGCFRVHASGLAYLPITCTVMQGGVGIGRKIRD